MKITSKSSGPSVDATKISSLNTGGDNLSPSRVFRGCSAKEKPFSTNATDRDGESGTEICDSLASAREAIYPVAAACVVLLTVLGICYSLYFAKAVMLPIVGAFLLNFLFSPLVLKMNRAGIPNVIGTFVVLGIAVGAIAIALTFAYEPATSWLAQREENLTIVKTKLEILQQPVKAIKDMSAQIDGISSGKLAEEAVPGRATDASAERGNEPRESRYIADLVPPASQGSDVDFGKDDIAALFPESVPETRNDGSHYLDYVGTTEQPTASIIPVEVQQPSISNRIFSTTGDAFAGISLMLVLLFYLLSAGDRGLEKLVKLMPTFRDKKRVVELSRAIEKSISNYLLTTTYINFGLGLVISGGMWAIGMPNPILWGVTAMFLNYFPFVGALIGATIVFLAAIVSFDSIAFSVWAPAIYLFANLIEANFITPVLLGRSVSLHPVWLMIFFVIVAWVWGLGGAIIAVPVLAVVKITCDHIEPLMPIGEFLGR